MKKSRIIRYHSSASKEDFIHLFSYLILYKTKIFRISMKACISQKQIRKGRVTSKSNRALKQDRM